jgi:hypothetical protein
VTLGQALLKLAATAVVVAAAAVLIVSVPSVFFAGSHSPTRDESKVEHSHVTVSVENIPSARTKVDLGAPEQRMLATIVGQ